MWVQWWGLFHSDNPFVVKDYCAYYYHYILAAKAYEVFETQGKSSYNNNNVFTLYIKFCGLTLVLFSMLHDYRNTVCWFRLSNKMVTSTVYY